MHIFIKAKSSSSYAEMPQVNMPSLALDICSFELSPSVITLSGSLSHTYETCLI